MVEREIAGREAAAATVAMQQSRQLSLFERERRALTPTSSLLK